MRVAMFDSRSYDRKAFSAAAAGGPHAITYIDARLTVTTAALAAEHAAVCVFVNDVVDAEVQARLHALGVRTIALRSAGFNHVDLAAARRLGLAVVRVPAYSPHAVAEQAVALVLALNRNIHRAYARVRDFNFSLEGLVGFDMAGKAVGIVGTGKVGRVAAKIFAGFGCEVIAYDPARSDAFIASGHGRYVPLPALYAESDIISLHVPLNAATYHLVDAASIAAMRRGVTLINTGRGGLVDTHALVAALKSGQVGAAGLDVYEEEEGLFFADHSGDILQDDLLARLVSFPNVIVTAHQAFLTREALASIARTTLDNLSQVAAGGPLVNEVAAPATRG